LFVGAGPASAEETLASVEQKINEAWNKVQSYTATLEFEGAMTKAFMTMTTKGTGPFEFMKVDGKSRYRSEIVNKVDMAIPLPDSMATQNVLTVFDGDLVYSEMKIMGQTKVIKRKPDSPTVRSAESGESLFANLRKKGELRLLPDETVDNLPAYVIELKPNAESQKDSPIQTSAAHYYIAKDTGILLQLVALDTSNNPITTVHYSNIKLNPKIDPARFTYTPPSGVKVEEGWDPKVHAPTL
jgi:outer membrane lipoprotein-sorting protein